MDAHVVRQLVPGRKVVMSELPRQTASAIDDAGDHSPERKPQQRKLPRTPEHDHDSQDPQRVLSGAKLRHMDAVQIACPQGHRRHGEHKGNQHDDADARHIARTDLFGDQVDQRRLEHHCSESRGELVHLVACIARVGPQDGEEGVAPGCIAPTAPLEHLVAPLAADRDA